MGAHQAEPDRHTPGPEVTGKSHRTGADATSDSEVPTPEDRDSAPLDTVAGDAAALFKALSDARRLQLVALAQQAPESEVCFCDLIDVFPLPQSSLSRHLRVLVDAGIFERERRGTWSWYRLRGEAVTQLTDSLRLDGHLHQLLRREHADNPKLIRSADRPTDRCVEPSSTEP